MATSDDIIGGVRRNRRISGFVDMSWPKRRADAFFEIAAYLFVIGAGVIFLVGMMQSNVAYFYVAIPISIFGAATLVQLHRIRTRSGPESDS